MAGGTFAGAAAPNPDGSWLINQLMSAFGGRDPSQPATGTGAGAFIDPASVDAPSVGPAMTPPPVNVAGVQGGPGSPSGGADPAQSSPVRQFVSDMANQIRTKAASAMAPAGPPMISGPTGAGGVPGAQGGPSGAAPSDTDGSGTMPWALNRTPVGRAGASVADTIAQVAQANRLQNGVQDTIAPPPAVSAGGGAGPMAAEAAPGGAGPPPLSPPPGMAFGTAGQGGPPQSMMEKLQSQIAAAKVAQKVGGGDGMNAERLSTPAPGAAPEQLPWAGKPPPAAAGPAGLDTPFGRITGQDVTDYLHRVALGAGAGVSPGDRSGGAAFLKGVSGGAAAGDKQQAAAAAGEQQKFKNNLATNKDQRETKTAGYRNAQILSSVMKNMNPQATLTQRVGVSKALTNFMNARAAQGVTGDSLKKEVEEERQRIMADPNAMQQPSVLPDDGTGTNDNESTAPAAAAKPVKAKGGPKNNMGAAGGYAEGTTATGKNGEKIVVRGGYWVRAQ